MSSKVAKKQEQTVKKENRIAKRNKLIAGILAGFLVFAMVASMIIGALSGIL